MMNKIKQTWQQVAGPSVIFSLAYAGSEGWLVGSNEGLWRCRTDAPNRATQFEILAESLRAAAITAVAVTPSYPREHLLLVGSVDGIARSVDDGKSWISARLTQPSQVSQIVLSPNFESDGIAFAATLEDGVLRSADYGQSWNSWNFGLLDLETLALAISPNYAKDETLIAATGTGIFRSTNGGRAWRELSFDEEALPPTGVAIIQNAFIVSTENSGVFYSNDAGASWSRRNAFRGGPTNALATSVDGNRLLLATPSTVAVSDDLGKTWQRAARSPDSAVCIALDASGAIICGTQDAGLWVYN